jgi:hypothetical protein
MRQARSGKPPAVKTAASAPAPASAPAKPTEVARSAHLETLRNRLGSTKPDSKNGETPTPFGRAKRPSSDEKAIDLDSTPPAPASAPARTTEDTRTAPLAAPRDRLGAASPKPKEEETPPPFGHAKRPSPDEKAVDLDSTPPQRRARIAPRPGIGSTSSSAQHEPAPGKEKQTTDNLVAAARRAAQAAALRVESREERRAAGKAADTTPRTEQPVRRRRSMLVIVGFWAGRAEPVTQCGQRSGPSVFGGPCRS